MLDVDDTAPTFDLTDHNGDSVSLDDYEGSRVVLYFYPKAKTGGCTREAQGFRDNLEAFAERGVEVLGVSTDSVELLSEFAEEQDLPFRLLSDEDGAVAR
ncbi:MAG: peroxiredoxin, partial [Halobacteriales archaeon]|nr:peroxiredoxin [Halobacteriales archaeon]